jgi:hypothetical protein
MIIMDFHMTIRQIHMNIMQIQNIYMYYGVTSSPMLVLIICRICLMLSAIKIPHTPDGYKGHLSIPLDIIYCS